MKLRRFAAVAIVFSSLAGGAAAETDDAAARLAAAQNMFAVEHREQNEALRIELLVDRSKQQFKTVMPNASDADILRYGTLLREELQRDMPQLMQLRAQYFADHFTLSELQDWTRMLQSDIGQKIVGAEPGMMRDMYNVDYAWVQAAVQRTMARYSRPDGAKPL